MYTTTSKPLSARRRLYATAATPKAVQQAIEASSRTEIAISRDPDDTDLCHAAQPFVPGSETVMVNGIHYYPADYTLELDAYGNATGFLIEMAEPADDIHLVADPVE